MLGNGLISFLGLLLISALLAAYVRSADASSHDFAPVKAALEYDRYMLESEVAVKPHFIMFYAPWCGHCQRLSGTFDKLALKYNRELHGDQVVIAKVDCTKHTDLCSDHNVLGYPTLMFFWSKSSVSKKYKGKRDFENLDQYVAQLLNSGPPPPEEFVTPPPSQKLPKVALYELTTETFDDHIATGQHFVKFFAPWCSHCQILAPTWQLLASKFEQDSEVTIAEVDCTKYNDICNKNSVRGYPTLIYFNRGLKMEQYNGMRDLNSLVEFVTMMKAKAASGPGAEAPKAEAPPDNVVPSGKPQLADSAPAHERTDEEQKDQQFLTDSNAGQPGGEDDQTLELTEDSFKQLLTTTQIHFVVFYLPWCPLCHHLKPIWSELAKRKQGPQITFSRIDCNQYKTLCASQEVRGYPDIVVYFSGHKHAVVDLTLDTFSSIVSSDKYTFVSFIHDGCIPCQDLVGVLKELGAKYVDEDWITIAKVDCSHEEKLCQLNGIDKYPTMILYQTDDRIGEFTGVRDVESLHLFVENSRRQRDEL